jgi:VWFA-related protein
VSDRDGQRVPGLSQADFTLYVNDEEVPIEYFTEVRDGAYVQTVDRYADAGVTAGKPSGTSFLVFIDEFFPLDSDKQQVLKALKKRVKDAGSWSSVDRVAVVSWDGKGITVLTDWTNDRRAVLAALDAAMKRPGLGPQRQLERQQYEVSLDPSDLAASQARRADRYRLGTRERLYADLLVGQLESTVSAAAAAMRGLDVIPGRKALLLLSGGWPMNVADWVGRSPTRSIQESKIPSGADLYGPLAQTANLLGYSIYGVDLPGFMQSAGSDASLASGRAPAYGSTEFFLEDDLHSSLRFLSAETGGLPLINSGRIGALGEVGQDVQSFYWIGFTPSWQRNDERHTVRVEVTTPDVLVRTRSGYTDLSPKSQINMAVQSSLLFGMGRPTSDLQMKVGQVEPIGDDLFYVDIEMSIPIKTLTIQQTANGYDAEAMLFVAALDASGGRSEVPAVPLLLSSPSPFPSKGLVAHTVTLKLRENTERVSMALYDVYGGATYTNTITKAEADSGG